MRVGSLLATILFAGLLGTGSAAAQNLAGTNWEDDDCMVGYAFGADGRFTEYDVDLDEIRGQWWTSGSTLYFRYDDGYSFSTTLEGNQFRLSYTNKDGSKYECIFMP